MLGAGRYFLTGLKLLSKPGIRPFVIAPIAISLVIYALMIAVVVDYAGGWIDALSAWLPSWLSFLESILRWLVYLLLMLVMALTFGLVASLLVSPFSGILSEKVELKVRGSADGLVSRSLAAEVGNGFSREIQKLLYYLPRALGLLLLSFIPIFSPFAPFLWFLMGAWMLAIQYIDYPMDNHGVAFKPMRLQLKQRRLQALGFGATVLVAMMIPLVNLVAIPAAVAGATCFWLDEFSQNTAEV